MNRLIEHLQFQIMQNKDIIEELSLADTDSLIEKEDIDYLKDENKYYEKVINELKDLQALKEELGCPLEVREKTLDSFYCPKFENDKKLLNYYVYAFNNEELFIRLIYSQYDEYYNEETTILLKDYKKTWALCKEDLKSE